MPDPIEDVLGDLESKFNQAKFGGDPDPDPINEPFPIFTLPKTTAAGPTWTLSEIKQSCSIIDPVFRIQFSPILDIGLTETFEEMKVPEFTFDLIETEAFGCVIEIIFAELSLKNLKILVLILLSPIPIINWKLFPKYLDSRFLSFPKNLILNGLILFYNNYYEFTRTFAHQKW